MKAGAQILVRTCANIQVGENVAIVTDPERIAIARELAREVEATGGIPSILMPPPRAIDNAEPGQLVAAALKAADVVFLPVTLAIAHTRAVREAIGEGARVLSMTAFTEGMMESGGLFTDFAARKPTCLALAQRLTKGSTLRVTNPAGTDLTMSLEGVTGNSHACLLDGPGFSAVPNIEANCSPTQESGEGVFVCDGSIPYYDVGVTREPVTFRISEGFVTSIEGGEQAHFLDELLTAQEDRWVYNLAQFAFGLNLDCTDFTGEMLNDEGVNGTVHIGVGTSANLGGPVSAKTHFDAICRDPTVWIDDEVVVRDGEVLIG
ncbi:MAG: aminopeptidase [Gemmatimonadales bacterium]|jgi:leucyl aminopeptidase (aminopeptidase T)|nr:aminopeptidase [Gemmatimonadales bacterium]MBT4438216.1 aminopeptidase [Gemmatimonadales bacterium]MBT5046150.1 aminopeptidase [Gemmatimonadales bacterium]MBT6887380.1 aminopeptidase [Gemmatimonadales bacterium]MDG2239545.1 aminopeptidase [Longimicrobiales bacterium]